MAVIYGRGFAQGRSDRDGFVVVEHLPTNHGFDEFFGIRDGFVDNYNHFYLHREGFHDLYEGTREVFFPGEYFPELMTERALEFLDRMHDQAFFLYVAFNIPHYPEQHLAEHAGRYSAMPMPRRTYAATVTTTDHYIGQVLDALDTLDAGVRRHGQQTVLEFALETVDDRKHDDQCKHTQGHTCDGDKRNKRDEMIFTFSTDVT